MAVRTLMLLSGLLLGPPAAAAATDGGLRDALQGILDRHEVPGLAVLLVDPGGVRQALALGYANLASRRPMSVDTLVRIGSITKTFNAIALLQLEAAGELSLDDRLSDFAPELPLANRWRPDHPVRLIHLMEHTAGLMDLSRSEFAHNEPFDSLRAAFDFAPERRQTHWPPGLFTEYSNVGAAYLGYVIEKVGGMPYARYLRERLLVPMGLSTATLEADGTTRQRLAVGYDRDGRSVIPYWHMTFPPMGAINATPLEMARLPRLFLRRGELDGTRLLAAPAVDRMETPRSSLAARAGLHYGYALGLDQEIDGHRRSYGHEGDGDGYLSHFGYQKDLSVGYFVTLNAFKREALVEIKQTIRGHLDQDERPPDTSVAATETQPPDRLVGEYLELTRRFDWEGRRRVTIERDVDGLVLVYPAGRRVALLPVANRLYRRPGEPIATLAIVEVDGRPAILSDAGNFGKN